MVNLMQLKKLRNFLLQGHFIEIVYDHLDWNLNRVNIKLECYNPIT